jgi:hypothetical protein
VPAPMARRTLASMPVAPTLDALRDSKRRS